MIWRRPVAGLVAQPHATSATITTRTILTSRPPRSLRPYAEIEQDSCLRGQRQVCGIRAVRPEGELQTGQSWARVTPASGTASGMAVGHPASDKTVIARVPIGWVPAARITLLWVTEPCRCFEAAD